ncbi:hypothetical protein D3C73_1213610 [compost metagenome]
MAGRRAGVHKRKGVALQAFHAGDAAVFAHHDQALVGALAGLLGHGNRERLDIRNRGSQHVGEGAQIRDVQLLGAQRFDDAVVVGGHERLHFHAGLLLQLLDHLLAGFDHGLRIFGGDQANGECVLRRVRGRGAQHAEGDRCRGGGE